MLHYKLSFTVVTVGITADVHLLVNESAGFVKICVEADHASQTTYEIVFRTVDGTATGIHYENLIVPYYMITMTFNSGRGLCGCGQISAVCPWI